MRAGFLAFSAETLLLLYIVKLILIGQKVASD